MFSIFPNSFSKKTWIYLSIGSTLVQSIPFLAFLVILRHTCFGNNDQSYLLLYITYFHNSDNCLTPTIQQIFPNAKITESVIFPDRSRFYKVTSNVTLAFIILNTLWAYTCIFLIFIIAFDRYPPNFMRLFYLPWLCVGHVTTTLEFVIGCAYSFHMWRMKSAVHWLRLVGVQNVTKYASLNETLQQENLLIPSIIMTLLFFRLFVGFFANCILLYMIKKSAFLN